MNRISLINKEHLISIINFINDNSDEFNYFKNIGWNVKNIESQFSKDNNYSVGYFQDNNLVAVLIGDTIKNDKDPIFMEPVLMDEIPITKSVVIKKDF